MSNFKNTYGKKSNGSTLEATEWNNLMQDLDNNFTSSSVDIEDIDPIDTSDLQHQSLLSNLQDNLNQILQFGESSITEAGVNSPRGAIARLGLDTNINKTEENLLASVNWNSGSQTLTENVYGDRVRFGSWYITTEDQTEFGCSHEYLEIVNSGSIDVDMSKVKLGVVMDNGVKSIPLVGGIKARSSYLIRGKKVGDSNSIIQINNCDIDISGALQWKNIQFNKVQAFVLYWKDMTFNSNTQYLNYIGSAKTCTGVNPYFIDFIIPNSANTANLVFGSNTNMFGNNPAYTLVENSIIKDLYALDPAKQAFRSLTTCTNEASNIRSGAVQLETIPLNNENVSFPHSKPKQPITKYTPKSSGEHKNILTDKTAPDFNKPNMVTCSFGIDALTTRCFNWFSMSRTDEFVWIRKQGERTWNKFESYKSGDGTTSVQNDTNTSMHRKNFHQSIINSVYKRIDNVFPGDSTYTYRVHKCVVYIQQAINSGDPIVYEYVVGQENADHSPNKNKCSEVQTFTIYPKTWKPKVYHVTDLQGFSWMEYQMWAAAAEEINNKITNECNESTQLFPIVINTGDMTQNGTRINEWLDYYNAGYSIFSHIEQMNVIGNNDLCNSYSEKALGIGNDDGKSSPYYFQVFYCYEIPNKIDTVANWTGPLIYNDVYIPSMYYFHFDKYYYFMVNSEISSTMASVYFKAKEDSAAINLYTGYKQADPKIYDCQEGFLGHTLLSWIDDMNEAYPTNYAIFACHEMPFTVTTKENLITTAALTTDRSLDQNKKDSLVGSHLNRLGNVGWDNDANYWFSRLLQNNGIKLCIGGHKHTYAITYPVADVYQKSEGNDYYITDNKKVSETALTRIQNLHNAGAVGKGAIIKRSALLGNNTLCATSFWNADNSLTDGVVYCMLQATGYKQTSNKELPSPYQTYSKIIPDTNVSGVTAKADESLKYPMYGTYEYETDKINICIFRVVNIAKEALSADVDTSKTYAVVTFSQTSNSTNKMYSEKLLYCPTYGSNQPNSYPNYWLVPNNYKDQSYSFVDGNLKTVQRCYYDNTTLKGFVKPDLTLQTLNPESTNYTMVVTL